MSSAEHCVFPNLHFRAYCFAGLAHTPFSSGAGHKSMFFTSITMNEGCSFHHQWLYRLEDFPVPPPLPVISLSEEPSGQARSHRILGSGISGGL